jgi:hypothetical protein
MSNFNPDSSLVLDEIQEQLDQTNVGFDTIIDNIFEIIRTYYFQCQITYAYEGDKDRKTLYYKTKDGNFNKVGPEFSGWPTDGVWLVCRDRSYQTHIANLGQSNAPLELAVLMKYSTAGCKALNEVKNQPTAPIQKIKQILLAITEAKFEDEQNKILNELKEDRNVRAST